jgi:hypothetical protein
MSASIMRRAALPNTSDTTESSLIPASSNTFWMRWVSRARLVFDELLGIAGQIP